MTHYDPEHVQDHLRLIDERKKTHPSGQRRGVLLTRGDVDDTWRKQVTEALSEFVGGEVDVIPMPHLGLDEAKELADPLKKLKYQLSFVRGYGGKMSVHKIGVQGSDYDKTIEL
jgi:hypothetical protein